MKPGWKTSEFWLTIAFDVGSLAGAVAEVLPPRWAAVAVVVAHVGYALSRGWAKSGS